MVVKDSPEVQRNGLKRIGFVNELEILGSPQSLDAVFATSCQVSWARVGILGTYVYPRPKVAMSPSATSRTLSPRSVYIVGA